MAEKTGVRAQRVGETGGWAVKKCRRNGQGDATQNAGVTDCMHGSRPMAAS